MVLNSRNFPAVLLQHLHGWRQQNRYIRHARLHALGCVHPAAVYQFVIVNIEVLLSPAVEVLEKYGWEVPRIENHVYNRILKVIGMMAGIKTPLHSHLARHTFATYMLRNGSRIENVSRMLGHKNITQTQHYAKVIAQSVHDDFAKIDKKLNKR